MVHSHIGSLRHLSTTERGVLLPGVPHALAARIVADLGFKASYLTGAGLTNAAPGLPDLGFMDLSQLVGHTMAIRNITELPLIMEQEYARKEGRVEGHSN